MEVKIVELSRYTFMKDGIEESFIFRGGGIAIIIIVIIISFYLGGTVKFIFKKC